MPAPRNGGQRLIERRRACELLVPPRSSRRRLPLFMLDHGPRSWLRRGGQAAAVDGFEDLITTAAEQRLADFVAELFRVVEVAVARFAEKLSTIGIGDDGFEMQLADPVVFANFSQGADGDLAASAQAVEQSTFAGGGGAGGCVVQKFQVLAGRG